MDKKEIRAKEIMESIRQVLLKKWDPLGVKDDPEAQDEYDAYVGEVYRLLASEASVEQVAEYLVKIENEQMGLGQQKIQDLLPVARRLLSLNIRL